jgi:hypothetical protein
LTAIRHPEYLEDEMYWYDWRDIYNGGQRFVRRNLKKFSNRETDGDFKDRKFYTPIPTFAKSAINDIRNAIFQRLRDVTRRGGSDAYMKACAGENGGVDNKGAAMQSFLGIDCLTELLVMGRVGIYVDMPQLAGIRTMADEGKARPYTYMYRVEDILSWAVAKPEEPGDFTALLVRDRGIDYNQGFAHGAYLPQGGFTRYRFMWIDPQTKKVKTKMYDEEDNLIDVYGNPLDGSSMQGINRDIEVITNEGAPESEAGVTTLELNRIPFAMPSIGGSLLKDVYKHQVALLNLGSSDVAYALKANYPFFIEQKDMRAVGTHLKKTVNDDGTTVTSDNSEAGTEGRTGVTHGRTYDLKADAPSFIHPSPEPLMASMKLQEKLEDDIRKLVNLAVQNKMGQRAVSAEAMKLSDQGLEAGLSYIGLVLESAERQIAEFWAAYEQKDSGKRKVATVKYPDRYSLKDDTDRISEAKELSSLMYSVPGLTVKKELSKGIMRALLAGKVSVDTLDTIENEIDDADYATSDPEIIIRAQEAGLVGEQIASVALGFPEDEYLQAREDHVDRVERISDAQAESALKAKLAEYQAAAAMGQLQQPGAPEGAPEGGGPPQPQPGGGALGNPATAPQNPGGENPAARGIPDLDADRKSGVKEREAATDTTLAGDKKKPVRGEGKSLNKGESE